VQLLNVILQIGLSREAHRTFADWTLKDALVCVLPKMVAQRLLAKGLAANVAGNLCLGALTRRHFVENLVEEKLGV